MTEPTSAGSLQPPSSGDYQHAPTAEARWQALKDYLDNRIAALKAEAEDWAPVAQMTREFEGKTATLASVRKYMDELEANDDD